MTWKNMKRWTTQFTRIQVSLDDVSWFDERNLHHNISWFVLRQCGSALSNNTPKWIFTFTACKTTNSIAVTRVSSVNMAPWSINPNTTKVKYSDQLWMYVCVQIGITSYLWNVWNNVEPIAGWKTLNLTCGNWTENEKLRERSLDRKLLKTKNKRKALLQI